MSAPDELSDNESDDWELSSAIWDDSAPSTPSGPQAAYNNNLDTSDTMGGNNTDPNLGIPNSPENPTTPNAPSPGLQADIPGPIHGSNREERLTSLMETMINTLESEGESFASWMAFIFDSQRDTKTKDLRRTHFWKHHTHITSLLDNWAHSRQYGPGRQLFLDWTRSRVARDIRTEASQITASKVLQSSKLDIGPEYLENFKIEGVRDHLQTYCSVSIQMFLALAGVDPEIKTLTAAPISARNVVVYSMVALFREYNQLNNLIQVVFGLFMYAAGLQRQAFAVLCHIGLLVSYTHLISGLGVSGQRARKKRTNDGNEQPVKLKKTPPAGPLKALANGCIARLERLARKGVLSYIFDNINLVKKVSEQVLGRIDSQMNGTCATAFEVTGATPEALDQQAALDSFLSARPLNIGDIILTPEEQIFHNNLMIHNILRVIVQHGGDHFGCYGEILEETQPKTEHLIEVHKSRFYSMPAMEIDESKVDGVIDVLDTINSKLKIDTTSPQYQGTVRFVGGDQKSVGNLRAAQRSRAGNDDTAFSFQNLIPLIGLFHMLMAAIVGFLTIHFGNPTANVDNPGSLSYHNTLLERKPFTLTSLPPVSVSRNLINVSLVARILHCLTLVTGSNLEAYIQQLQLLDTDKGDVKTSWARLVSDATKLHQVYANADTVHDLRAARKVALPGEKAGDMVFENALLFLRDSLVIRELITATKRGDPGRIILNLKVLALSFRGSGRVQYTYEALSMIHNVQVVWPTALRDLALRNWLLNPTGQVDSWVPLDLVQEHANFWIKTVYNATGSSASWSWLAAISPCTEALRNLVRDLSGTLGTYLGTKHTSPDSSLDVAKLIRNLDDRNIYRLRPGRTLNGKDEPAFDMQSVGLQKLMNGRDSGINEYNRQFKSTQMAYRVPPVSQTVPHSSLPRRSQGDSEDIAAGLDNLQFQVENELEEGGLGDEGAPDAAIDDPDAASDDETPVGENVEDLPTNDFEWAPQDDESWLDDLEIFQD